jgi:hypothetical protein
MKTKPTITKPQFAQPMIGEQDTWADFDLKRTDNAITMADVARIVDDVIVPPYRGREWAMQQASEAIKWQ